MIRLLGVAAFCLHGFAAAGAADLKLWSGGAAPALELADLEGRRHRLADYRGKVVLVNFWATWCAPCREEMPSIQRLKDRLAGRPFAVLAVNLDEPEERVRRFLAQTKLDFTILLDQEKRAARAWQVRILPASFVIGADGKIRYTLVGDLDWGHELVVNRIAELLPAGR
ncbi:MAG TPA: TlpA disulfide reductase family protein [Burkholderiales bacterium]|nr:TlpA disulfide reductase family protein [Burkholderiales bacterium]